MHPGSNLPETFSRVRKSIVAFATAWATIAEGENPPLLPKIIGTGFIVDERGIVITNRHVVEALDKLPRMKDCLTRFAMVFTEITSVGTQQTMAAGIVPLKRRFVATTVETPHTYYGELAADLAIIQLAVRDVPALHVANDEWRIRAGMPIATAGFPLGTDPLAIFGNVNQVTPTLRHGIVSGVFPFEVPHAHGFTIDIMSQGGASGSPVFDPENGDVLGVIHAGFPGTNISIAVPGWLVSQAVDQLLQKQQWDFSNTQTLTDYTKGDSKPDNMTWEHVATFRSDAK
ncbi:MAG TPA: serine protease [Chthoniobacterales bacterium]|nr:serine protease [Chthoniobacterales bacterium]